MARRPRYHLHQGFYHVMIRGNDKQSVFFCENDYRKMSLLIQEGVERFKHKILAYCFMENHVHLIIQVDTIPLSCIMQNITFRYTRYVNRVYGKVGHLFQGRYKAIIVDGEPYLKELIRYVHLNPVRAGIVKLPELYYWSSHNVYLGNADLTWIDTSYMLNRFGAQPEQAVVRYKNFIHAGIGLEEDCIYERGMDKGILGNEQFVAKVQKSIQKSNSIGTLTVQELVQAICDQYKVDESNIKDQNRSREASRVRAVLALLVREIEHITLEELAEAVGRDASSLSKQATRLEIKSLQCKKTQKELCEVRAHLVKCQA